MSARMLLIAFFAGLLLASEHLPLAQSQCAVLDIEWEPPEIRCVADDLPNHKCNTEFYFNGSREDFEEHFGNPDEISLDIDVTRESEGIFSCGFKDSTIESGDQIILWIEDLNVEDDTTELQGDEGDSLQVECDYKPGAFTSRYSVEWTYETSDGQKESISLDFKSKLGDGLDLVPSNFTLIIKHLSTNANASCEVTSKGQGNAIDRYIGKTNIITVKERIVEVDFGPEHHRDADMLEETEITCFSSNENKLEFYWTINGQQVEPELSEEGGGNGDTESEELAKIDGLKVVRMDNGREASLNASMAVMGTSESVYNITCRGFYRDSNDSASNYTLLTVKKVEGNGVSPSATLAPAVASTGMTDPTPSSRPPDSSALPITIGISIGGAVILTFMVLATTIFLLCFCKKSKGKYFFGRPQGQDFFGPGDPMPQRPPNNPEIYVAPSSITTATETSSDPTVFTDNSGRTAPMPTFNYQFPFFTLSNPSLFSAVGGSYQPHNGSRIGSGSSQYEHLDHGLEGNSASNTHLHPPGSPRSHYDQAFSPDRNVLQQQQQPAQQVQQAQLQQQAQPQFQPPPVFTRNQQFLLYLHQLVMHSPNCPLPGCPCRTLQHDFNKLMAYQKVAVESANAAVAAAATSGQYFTYAPNVNGVPGPSPYTQQLQYQQQQYQQCQLQQQHAQQANAAFGGGQQQQPQANFRHNNQNPIQQPPAQDYSGHTHTTTTTDHRSHHEVDASQRNGTSVCGGHGHGPDASCAARPTDLKFNSLNSSTVPHFHLAQTPTVRKITEPVVFKRQRSRSTSAVDASEICDTLTPLPDFLPTPVQKRLPLLRQKSMSADNIPVLCINGCRVFSPQKETRSPFKPPNAASNDAPQQQQQMDAATVPANTGARNNPPSTPLPPPLPAGGGGGGGPELLHDPQQTQNYPPNPFPSNNDSSSEGRQDASSFVTGGDTMELRNLSPFAGQPLPHAVEQQFQQPQQQFLLPSNIAGSVHSLGSGGGGGGGLQQQSCSRATSNASSRAGSTERLIKNRQKKRARSSQLRPNESVSSTSSVSDSEIVTSSSTVAALARSNRGREVSVSPCRSSPRHHCGSKTTLSSGGGGRGGGGGGGGMISGASSRESSMERTSMVSASSESVPMLPRQQQQQAPRQRQQYPQQQQQQQQQGVGHESENVNRGGVGAGGGGGGASSAHASPHASPRASPRASPSRQFLLTPERRRHSSHPNNHHHLGGNAATDTRTNWESGYDTDISTSYSQVNPAHRSPSPQRGSVQATLV